MADTSRIGEHMEVIGADGVDVGRSRHKGHHHYIPTSLVAGVEGDTVRLSANADVAVTFEEEADSRPKQ